MQSGQDQGILRVSPCTQAPSIAQPLPLVCPITTLVPGCPNMPSGYDFLEPTVIASAEILDKSLDLISPTVKWRDAFRQLHIVGV